jgi:hypothetical protein
LLEQLEPWGTRSNVSGQPGARTLEHPDVVGPLKAHPVGTFCDCSHVATTSQPSTGFDPYSHSSPALGHGLPEDGALPGQPGTSPPSPLPPLLLPEPPLLPEPLLLPEPPLLPEPLLLPLLLPEPPLLDVPLSPPSPSDAENTSPPQEATLTIGMASARQRAVSPILKLMPTGYSEGRATTT